MRRTFQTETSIPRRERDSATPATRRLDARGDRQVRDIVNSAAQPRPSETGPDRRHRAQAGSPLRRGADRPIADSLDHSKVVEGLGSMASQHVVAQRDRLFRRLLILADALAAMVALALTTAITGHASLEWSSLGAVPVIIVASKLLGLYDRDELVLHKTTLDESPALFQLATLCTLLVAIFRGAVINGPLSTIHIVGIWVILFGAVLCARAVARRLARTLATEERCLVVGEQEVSDAVRQKLETAATKARLVAALPLALDVEHEAELRAIETVIREQRIHRAILAPRVADGEAMLDVIRLVKLLGVRVSILPRLFEVVGSSVVFDDLSGMMVLGVPQFGLSRSSKVVKRTMDMAGAVIGLIAVAPVGLALAVAIRLETRGPVLFRQTRVGRDGEPFEMLKFRTMVDGAEAMKADLRHRNEAEDLFKIADDPRVTRIGRGLRRTSLDELPQLLNVLKGDMSLVGPRPLVIDEDSKIEGWHRRRLHLTPGMTGPWQVLGSSRIPLHEMVKLDYLYAANWSLFSDVKLILRTIHYVTSRSGM